MNSIPSMRQNHLVNVLTDCIPKILQLLEVILARLILQMDCNAIKRQKVERSKIQDSYGGQYFAMANKRLCFSNGSYREMHYLAINSNEKHTNNYQETDERSIALAHIIIEILNTIEAGSKMTAMGTTEVLLFVFYIYHLVFCYSISIVHFIINFLTISCERF